MATVYETEATKGHSPWTRTSEIYNASVGRATRKGATALIEKINARLPFSGPDVQVIDLGAGTGAVTLTLANAYPEARILACDISEGMLTQLLKARAAQLAEKSDAPKQDLVSTRVLDVQHACGVDGEAEGFYSHAISTFVLEVVLDPQAAVNNMFRLLKPNSGFVAAIAHWDYSRQCDPHGVWEEATTEVDPSYKPAPRNVSSDWDSREHFERGMRQAGFHNVEGTLFKCRFDIGLGADGFMEFFWNSQNPFTIERKRSWPGDLMPVKEAMGRIVEERITSGKGIWTDMGLVRADANPQYVVRRGKSPTDLTNLINAVVSTVGDECAVGEEAGRDVPVHVVRYGSPISTSFSGPKSESTVTFPAAIYGYGFDASKPARVHIVDLVPVNFPRIPLSLILPAGAAAWSYLNAKWGISGDANLIALLITLGIRQYRLEKADRVNGFYWLEESAQSSTTGPRNFLWFEGQTWTYQQTYDLVLRYAHWLKHTHQVASGDIVAIDLMNHPRFVFVFYAIWSLGAKPALINYNLTGEPLLHCAKASNARVLLYDDAISHNFTPEIKQKLGSADFRNGGKGNVELTELNPALDDRIASTTPHREPDVSRSGQTFNKGKDKMAALIFTSGTTGLPKPAIVSWVKFASAGPVFNVWGKFKKDDIYYTCMPLYHSTALILALFPCQYVGGCLAIGRKFSNTTFWPEVRASGSTCIQYVGETNRYLLAAPPQKDPVTGENLDKKHNVHTCYGNGMRPDVWDRFKERFGIETVGEFYSASESPQSSWNLSRNTFTSGAIGRAGKLITALVGGRYKIVEIDIDTEEPKRDPNNHNFIIERPAGEPGEVLYKLDPANISLNYQGYYGNEGASSKKVLHDCFEKGDVYYRTGDILRIDHEGRQFFVDRIGDTFRWRSENVSTNEVSAVLGRHPSISEANVYGVEVPHHDGRAGCAAVTFSVPEVTDELMGELGRYATDRLPKFAVPVFVRVTRDQMVTGNNKQQKHIFRKQGVDLGLLPAEDEMWWFNGGRYRRWTDKEWGRLREGQLKL